MNRPIGRIRLLGSDKPVMWSQTALGLELTLPERVTLPFVLRIETA